VLIRKPSIRLMPAVCDVSVTDACNAACDFCGFARQKRAGKKRHWIDRGGLARGLPLLSRRGVKYLGIQGGEPLLHAEVDGIIADAVEVGLRVALVTNGWLLPSKIDAMADAGLRTLTVSLDSENVARHELNRGLSGLTARIQEGLERASRYPIFRIASITVSRLVDFEGLPETLGRLGFQAVTFSYPRSEPFRSSSLAYGDSSPLVDFSADELIRILDSIERLKAAFPVLNPSAGLQEIRRHLRGEPEIFPCVGGYKYFYIDWNLNVWRCEAWHQPLGPLLEFDRFADQRDRCTACTMSCYRDTSVLMHAGVAAGDAASHLRHGAPLKALSSLFSRSVAMSVGAIFEEARVWAPLAGIRVPRHPEHAGTGSRAGRVQSQP
jgi:MoaA/NifB/PqqE/SkfB family radical SAM enzyme